MKLLNITAAALAIFSTALAAPPGVTRNDDVAASGLEAEIAGKCHYQCEYEYKKCLRGTKNDKNQCKKIWCIKLGSEDMNCRNCKHCAA